MQNHMYSSLTLLTFYFYKGIFYQKNMLCKYLIVQHPDNPVPIDVDAYLGNRKEYTRRHVQYPYIMMLPDSYLPLTGLELKL